MLIRPAIGEDADSIWRLLEPVLGDGEAYTLPRDMIRSDALAYWSGTGRRTFVAEGEGRILGTYYLRPNQLGGGTHVANCGYITDTPVRGRGIARAMCLHSLDEARRLGFRAMQFNFVVSTNEPALRLLTRCPSSGFSGQLRV
jgi:predicted GNAT family acetyltransferase